MDETTIRWMLDDLLGNRLEVAKLPSRLGGYTRVVVSQNAPWYQEFCRKYEGYRRVKKWKKARTIIKRSDTAKALRRMILGNFSGVYAERLLEAATQLERS